jgi:hypothetical protein
MPPMLTKAKKKREEKERGEEKHREHGIIG